MNPISEKERITIPATALSVSFKKATSTPAGAFFIQCLNLRIDYTTGTNWVDKMI